MSLPFKAFIEQKLVRQLTLICLLALISKVPGADYLVVDSALDDVFLVQNTLVIPLSSHSIYRSVI